MAEYVRKPNVFEKLLLAVGVGAVIIGYGLIHKLIITGQKLTYDVVISIFLWYIIIIFIMLAAVAENIKEEFRQILGDEVKKIKLFRKK